MVRRHARGQRLIEPHLLFLLRFVHIAPARCAGRPRARNIRCHFAVLHGVAHTALQRASPDRRVVAAAALVVALEPLAQLAQLHQVGRAADAAAQVGEIEIARLLLFGDGIVELPEVHGALIEFVPVFDGPRRRQLAALLAIADRQIAQRRPGVGEERVHVVERVDLLHDGRHVVGHIRGEHARAEQTRVLGVMRHIALPIALEPLGVGLDRVFPIEVGTHARHHVDATLLRRRAAIAEEIAIAEKFALAVERHLGLVECQNSGDADHHGIHFEAGPVIGPLFDIEHRRVMLGHIGLADAADSMLPGDGSVGSE